eukprot:CAMPEP_0201560150 /NCGR_PEP_ID=MMETSP0173_2-20130828/78118_1 /ASSEMBLY_ACC=CAM_ASM_000268 /TAXON_ID=218659 /ORGANISM="Vexillifera sp., Strain DIVA3 564/2" /LENGTH=243 /DNA_ID=CAMNT_0047974587 /DNA_START=1855 /DNA_END=2587 /DNA_ORIENTATION=-
MPNDVNGVSYPDLGKLTKADGDYTDIGQDGATWVWNFCKAETTTDCGETGTVVCQNNSGAIRSCGTLAGQTITAGTTGATPTPSDPTDGVTFYYGKGRSSSGCGRDRETTIYVTCDPNQATPTVVTKPNEVPAGTCQYYITMSAAAACKGGSGKPTGDKSSSDSPGGLSGGSIFLITISCCFVAYMLAGMGWKYHKYQATGVEMVPNIDFWREFPGLVKEGAMWTWGKITGNGSDAGTYDTVE